MEAAEAPELEIQGLQARLEAIAVGLAETQETMEQEMSELRNIVRVNVQEVEDLAQEARLAVQG